MNDLRISKKRNKYVILNYSDNRKQIGKGVTNKTDANILLKQLIADVATKKKVITKAKEWGITRQSHMGLNLKFPTPLNNRQRILFSHHQPRSEGDPFSNR